jgi:F-type H+-transporting ATPase subunit b
MVMFAATTAAEEGKLEGIIRQFGWHPQLFFSQLVLFVIVAMLLNKFAYKPVLDILAQRREKIAEGAANADKIKEELSKAEESRKEILGKANDQANGLIEQARAAAAKVQEVETQKAVAAAEEIVSKARQAMDADRAQMFTDLKKEVGRLVVETTAKVVGKTLSDDDQQRLISEANKQLTA